MLIELPERHTVIGELSLKNILQILDADMKNSLFHPGIFHLYGLVAGEVRVQLLGNTEVPLNSAAPLL